MTSKSRDPIRASFKSEYLFQRHGLVDLAIRYFGDIQNNKKYFHFLYIACYVNKNLLEAVPVLNLKEKLLWQWNGQSKNTKTSHSFPIYRSSNKIYSWINLFITFTFIAVFFQYSSVICWLSHLSSSKFILYVRSTRALSILIRLVLSCLVNTKMVSTQNGYIVKLVRS